MASVACGYKLSQRNKDFVQNHVITRSENEKITLKMHFKRIYPEYANIHGSWAVF